MPIIPAGTRRDQKNQGGSKYSLIQNSDFFNKVALQNLDPAKMTEKPPEPAPETQQSKEVGSALNDSMSPRMNQGAMSVTDQLAGMPPTHREILQNLLDHLNRAGLLASPFHATIKSFDIKPEGFRIEVINNPNAGKVVKEKGQ